MKSEVTRRTFDDAPDATTKLGILFDICSHLREEMDFIKKRLNIIYLSIYGFLGSFAAITIGICLRLFKVI